MTWGRTEVTAPCRHTMLQPRRARPALRCAASGFLAQVAELVDEASRLLLDVAIAMPALLMGQEA